MDTKEKIHNIDILFIISLFLFGIGSLVCIRPIIYGDLIINDGKNTIGNFMFITIMLYCVSSFACYLIGMFKEIGYNLSSEVIKDHKYRVNHYYGMWNLIMIFPLSFGMLFMIMTNNINYGDFYTLSFFILCSIFFLISLILRSTILKKEYNMGVRCFDVNNLIFFSYGSLMILLNILKIRVEDINNSSLFDSITFISLVILNFILTHFMVYYPSKAIVYSFYKEEYNPIKTIYKFIKLLMMRHIFFFIGLSFTTILGTIYMILGYKDLTNINHIYVFISWFYLGMVSLRLITFIWSLNIKYSKSSDIDKMHALYKVMLTNSIITFFLTLFLSSLLFVIYNDKINQSASWLVFIQGGFVSFRFIILLTDVIKSRKTNNPYDIMLAGEGILTTLVMIYSFVITILVFFGFINIIPIVSIVIVILLIVISLLLNIDMLIRSIKGLKNKNNIDIIEE